MLNEGYVQSSKSTMLRHGPSLVVAFASIVRVTAMSARPIQRVLVLHGKGSSGPKMSDRFKRIKAAFPPAVEFVFPTAPHSVGDGFAWWQLNEGERSFTATEFVGLDESLNLLRRLGRFEAVWGHSQGAILLAAVLARQSHYGGCFGHSPPVFAHSKYLKYILNGSAWPNPFQGDLERIASPLEVRILHCYGKADSINPPDQAKRLAHILGGSIYEHDGGHYVPDDDAAVAAYTDFLLAS